MTTLLSTRTYEHKRVEERVLYEVTGTAISHSSYSTNTNIMHSYGSTNAPNDDSPAHSDRDYLFHASSSMETYGDDDVPSVGRSVSLSRFGYPSSLRIQHDLRTASTVGALLVFLLLVLGFVQHNSSNGDVTNVDQPDLLPIWTPLLREAMPRADSVEKHYEHQLVDHFAADQTEHTAVFSQRYYESERFFQGPGHPFLVIVGGQHSNDKGLSIPFVAEYLASILNAYVLQPEHRFYGKSWPVQHVSQQDVHSSDINKDIDSDGSNDFPSSDRLRQLQSPHQTMADLAQIVQHMQEEHGCSLDPSSKDYCPVIAVGGGMSGVLATMMRLTYPNVVDIAYASSAPLKLHTHYVNTHAYFEKITQVAESASSGCSNAVHQTLLDISGALRVNDDQEPNYVDLSSRLGICADTMPSHIQSSVVFQQELVMNIANRFAKCNMEYYPPGPETSLVAACNIFQDSTMSAEGKIASYLMAPNGDESQCFDLSSFVRSRPHSTLSADNHEEIGRGLSQDIWDLQICDLLTNPATVTDASMFPVQEYSDEWLDQHCHSRSDSASHIQDLMHDIGVDDLAQLSTTRMLVVNGMNDGWSMASQLETQVDLRVVNIPSGAHHSELSQTGPFENDTLDMQGAYTQIARHLLDLVRVAMAERSV